MLSLYMCTVHEKYFYSLHTLGITDALYLYHYFSRIFKSSLLKNSTDFVTETQLKKVSTKSNKLSYFLSSLKPFTMIGQKMQHKNLLMA